MLRGSGARGAVARRSPGTRAEPLVSTRGDGASVQKSEPKRGSAGRARASHCSRSQRRMGRSHTRADINAFRSAGGSDPVPRKCAKTEPARALCGQYLWDVRPELPLPRPYGPGNSVSQKGPDGTASGLVAPRLPRGRARPQRRYRRSAGRDRRDVETQTRGDLGGKVAGNISDDGRRRSAGPSLEGENYIHWPAPRRLPGGITSAHLSCVVDRQVSDAYAGRFENRDAALQQCRLQGWQVGQ